MSQNNEQQFSFLKDLEECWLDAPVIGCTIYLVRKVSGHVLETKLNAVSIGTVPQVEVEWLKSYKYQYRLNLKDNTVHAIDATTKHKDEMKLWYEVWEPQRKLLVKLCEEMALKEKKRKKKL
jgi:hypothetical protein